MLIEFCDINQDYGLFGFFCITYTLKQVPREGISKPVCQSNPQWLVKAKVNLKLRIERKSRKKKYMEEAVTILITLMYSGQTMLLR